MHVKHVAILAAPAQNVHPESGAGAYTTTTAIQFQRESTRTQSKAMFGLDAELVRLTQEPSAECRALRRLTVVLELASRFIPTTVTLHSLQCKL
jgi:hypothetical protein